MSFTSCKTGSLTDVAADLFQRLGIRLSPAELAADPEMMSRVFEDLLAEPGAEKREAARRNGGVYYTPRPIVSYMCRKVLLRHIGLDITSENGKAIVHKLLHETRVIDPASGSGAFILGMLEEMMAVLDIAEPGAGAAERYRRKLVLLRNCLFGIDVMEGAVEITKLRCRLSLIAEQRAAATLPEPEFNFTTGNALLRGGEGKTTGEGFDIVIGNPPYVNTRLIQQMGMRELLKAEYGWCDDLYHHFTFRGIELLKPGGYLSYICSDTFLRIASKENMRRLFLGLAEDGTGDADGEKIPCRVVEIIHTPKSFAAMVDTVLFILQKEAPVKESEVIYTDMRNADGVRPGIGEGEWGAPDHPPQWKPSHSCKGTTVFRDAGTPGGKWRIALSVYQQSMNHSIFPPNPYNCLLFDKVARPAAPVLSTWWPKIATSSCIAANRAEIRSHLKKLKAGETILLGMITDGGVGLQTGDNGVFLGAIAGTRSAERIRETRPGKLWRAIGEYPRIRKLYKAFRQCETEADVREALDRYEEPDIHSLFDGIKQQFGRRVFGKGAIYKVIDAKQIADIDKLSNAEKKKGIDDQKGRRWVSYFKGDRAGNKWLAETEYVIDWSGTNVARLMASEEARFQNEQFYFLEGFSWNLINGTRTSNDFKVKFIPRCINDVGGMKLSVYPDMQDIISAKFLVCLFNSRLVNRLTEAFINFTLNFQLNDARQIPIRIPTKKQLGIFNSLFDACYRIKEGVLSGASTEEEGELLLGDKEREIEEMVEELYGLRN